MKVSARNVFSGTVQSITPGSVNAEVLLALPGGDSLVAIVTLASICSLGLAVGQPAIALVKAPWVILVTDAGDIRFSARNQLQGTISALQPGTVNTEVALTLPGGTTVYAVITNDASKELGLAVGAPATALIKASHVVLGVPA